jgi:hypothetical protein
VVTLESLIGRVSPSRLETAARCLAQFAFRYIERLPERFRAAMQFGNAVDATGNGVYEAKLKSGETAPVRDVQDRFAAAWDWEASAVDDWEGEERGALLDVGVRCVSAWRDRIAVHVVPEAVQEKLETVVADPSTGEQFTLTGYLDVRGNVPSKQRRVVADLKTSGRAYRPDVFARRFQPVTYTLLTGIPTFEYHVLTTTKEPQTQIMRATLPDSDRESFLRRAGMLRRQVAHAFTSGDWLPNRGHMLCSRRFCEFWSTCEKRHGGRVPE